MDTAAWEKRGYLRLAAADVLGQDAPALLHDAATVAAQQLDSQAKEAHWTQQAWVSGKAFPFPGAEGESASAHGALNRLTVHEGQRAMAEALLRVDPGGVRLVHSGLLQEGPLSDSAALTLRPDAWSGDATSEALVLFTPLVESTSATVLVCRFDPQKIYAEAASAAEALRLEHPLVLRTILRKAEAAHIQCDSSQQSGPGLAELLRGLSPEQRNLAFGFPLPGHPFWDRGTAAATAARYKLDPAPYLDALPPPERPVDAAEEEAAESFIFGGPEGRGTSAAKPEGWMPLPPAVWEAPAQTLPLDSADVLTAGQIEQWHTKGWLVLDNIWPSDAIAAAAAAAAEIYPKPTPGLDPPEGGFTADTPDFPFSRSALNDIVLHPRILRAAAQLLKVENEDVRFYGDVVLGKYGVSPPDGDQDLHLDFGNNTLLVPPGSAPETVNVILNYSEDAIETDGATRFVAEHGLCALAPQPGEAPAQASPFYDSSEALYERERAVRYTAGTCLLYRLDFLHRGSPVLPGKVRWTHHTNYKRADCEWIGRNTWARNLWELEKSGLAGEGFSKAGFLGELSELQRVALGVPHATTAASDDDSCSTSAPRRLGAAPGKL